VKLPRQDSVRRAHDVGIGVGLNLQDAVRVPALDHCVPA
jgi:hypothetical protein